MKKRKFAVLLSILSIGLTGCNQKNTCEVPSTEVVIKKAIVVLKENDREYLAVGETNQLSAYSSGNSTDKFAFKSLDEEKATVDENGLVKALAVGDVKIEVSLKSDSSVKKTVFFTIVKNLMQSLPELQDAVDDIKSYDYEKGVNISLDAGISLGNISLSTSFGDYSIYDTYENPISIPFDFDIQSKKGENNQKENFFHTSLNVKELIDSLKNALPNDSDVSLDDIPLNSFYQVMANQIAPDFASYLRSDDYSGFGGFDFYSYGKSDTYVTMSRNFSNDENPDYRAFAFNQGNLLNLLSPYADEILSAVIKSLAGQTQDGMNGKLDDMLNKLFPGYSIDTKELFTDDGMLFLQTILVNFLETTTEGNKTIVALNKKAMETVQEIYSKYVETTDYSFPIYNGSLGSFSLKMSLPEKLSGVKIVIDNSLTGTHKTNQLSLIVEGSRKVNDVDVSYPFVSLNMNHPEEKAEGDMNQLKTELETYKDASVGIDDVFSSSLLSTSTLGVSDLIEKSNQIYDAEIEYGANLDNENLKSVKNQLLAYYYSDAYKSEERQNLLYPMYNRLSNLDFSNQDDYVESYTSSSVSDNGDCYYSVNHFQNGQDVADFEKNYTSSDEKVITVDENGKLTGHMAYYNGQVVGGIKSKSDSSTVTIRLDNGNTFRHTFTYSGKNVGFESTKTAFKQGLSEFDYDTRELTVSGDKYDLENLLSFPENSTVSYQSTSLTQGTFSPLKRSELRKGLLAKADVLGGIVVTVRYVENGQNISENVVLYFKF